MNNRNASGAVSACGIAVIHPAHFYFWINGRVLQIKLFNDFDSKKILVKMGGVYHFYTAFIPAAERRGILRRNDKKRTPLKTFNGGLCSNKKELFYDETHCSEIGDEIQRVWFGTSDDKSIFSFIANGWFIAWDISYLKQGCS